MHRSLHSILIVASLVGAATTAFANGKAEIRERMLAIDSQILSLRTSGGSAVAIERLQSEYQQLSERLGGGRVVAPRQQSSPAALEGTLASTPLQVVTPVPPGSSATTTSFNGSGGVLPDVSTVQFTLPVSGVGTYLWDVDLVTNITHTWCGDLEITLIAPSGKSVTIANDDAEGYTDVFNGTLWDDSTTNGAYSYPYVDFSTATPLAPDGSFHRLIGDNPNGTWTLRINDDAGGDSGNLSSWRLDVTTLAAPPVAPSAPTTFSRTPNVFIPDLTVVSDSLTASGLGTNLAELKLHVGITHTYNSDLIFDLISPGGTSVRLSSYNGFDNDDVFNGTDIYDFAAEVGNPLNDAPIAQYPYVDGVAAVEVNPEVSLTALDGQNPNGVWTLQIEDTAGADTGNLGSWSLTFRTYGGSPGLPSPYCTAGTTTNGCVASITGSANPSVSFANACTISVANVEGQKNAILFYGLASNAVPWAAGSSSYLCVKAPTQRTGTQSSGGTLSQCDGTLTLNWNAFQLANPGALGAPWVVGEKAYVQAWFRDPPAPKTTNLSNGLELTYQP